jgi:hypothetical protein
MTMKNKKCFACDRRLGRNPRHAATSDGQAVAVGSECYKLIGPDGYQPSKGGPRLYRARFKLEGSVWHFVKFL